MKMKKILIITLVGLASASQSEILLQDYFLDGNLGTSAELNGGFYEISNGEDKDGTSFEASGVAEIVNGTKKNITGIVSTNKVTFDPQKKLITTWTISNYSIPNQTKYIAVAWQTADGFTHYPELEILTDLETKRITFSADGTNEIGHLDLDLSFEDLDGFTLISEFDSTGYLIQGFGVNLAGGVGETNIIFSGNWSGAKKTYEEISIDQYRIGAFVNGQLNGQFSYSIEDVSVESIPEPAVIGLIGAFGCGMLAWRRIFRQPPGEMGSA